MGKKNNAAEAMKGTVQNDTKIIKTSNDRSINSICNAIKEVEDKNKNIKKKITACCKEIKQEIQKLE